MEKKKFSKIQTASLILAVVGVIVFFLPFSTSLDMFSLNGKLSYNIIDIVLVLFGAKGILSNISFAYAFTLTISALLVITGFAGLITLIVLILKNKSISFKRYLCVAIFVTILLGGFLFNNTLTGIAKTGNNFYGISPEFKLVIKNKYGSINQWSTYLPLLKEDPDNIFTPIDEKEMEKAVDELIAKADSYGYAVLGRAATDKEKKKINNEIFEAIKEIIPEDEQVTVFTTYFMQMVKSVTAVSSTIGIGYYILVLLALALCTLEYNELNDNGFKNSGIKANDMFAGIACITLGLEIFFPVFNVENADALAKGITGITFPALIHGFIINKANALLAVPGFILMLAGIVGLGYYILLCKSSVLFKKRRYIVIASSICYFIGSLLSMNAFGGIGSYSIYTWLAFIFLIADSLICFTADSDIQKFPAFSIVNVILFIIICAIILVPLWKVLVDSLDAKAGFGMRLWPQKFTLVGYLKILQMPSIRNPFLISVLTTVVGTVLGLLISTLGAYVLIQFEMPGRGFLAGLLLFTLVFEAGMVPNYLLYLDLNIYNTLLVAILPMAVNVYNLVLMRNFFDGIPKSLFESAAIDGCSPMGIFIKIVLPLSKAALASIGLMFSVAYWNEYTHYKLYIPNTSIHNFQMKLRSIIFEAGLPNAGDAGIETETLKNASIIIAILPFMIIYPFLQQYFVKGVNIGAVKE